MINKKKKSFSNNQNFFLKGGFFSIQKCLIFVFSILIVLFFLNLTGFSNQIRNGFYSFSEPVQEWFWARGSDLSSFFEGLLNSSRLERENDWLLKENRKLVQEQIEIEDLEKENEQLRRALGVSLEKDFDLEMAKVIALDRENHLITINKGGVDGLRVNFPVVTEGKVLIGDIVEVYENISKIRLLSFQESLVDVEVVSRNINALLKGEGKKDSYLLDLIPKESEIASGDLVVTSNLGEEFPENLLIGHIEEIIDSDKSSFKEAEIIPSYNLTSLDNVFIILNSRF